MMIIKRGVEKERIKKCENCNTVFSFNINDIVSSKKYYKIKKDRVLCPVCKYNIVV